MAGTNADFYSLVQRRIWNDAGFRKLSRPAPNARDLFLYLLTTPHATQVPGLVSLGEAAMAEDLEWPVAGLRKALAELETAGMVNVDRSARLLWLPNGMKHNPPKSPDNILGWAKHWRMLPECDLLRAAAEAMMAAFLARGSAFALAFSRTSGLPMPDAEAPPVVPPTPHPMGTPKPLPPPRHQIQESESQSESQPKEESASGGSQIGEPEQMSLVPDDPTPKRNPAAEVFAVWLAGWREHVHHGREPLLTKDRQTKIRARLAEGYDAEDLKAAVRGIWQSDWHREKQQTDLALALQDGAHLDRFRVLDPQAKALPTSTEKPAWMNQLPRRTITLRDVEALADDEPDWNENLAPITAPETP